MCYITKCEEIYEYEMGIIKNGNRANLHCGGRGIKTELITTHDIAHRFGVGKRECQEMLQIVKRIPQNERIIQKSSRGANKRSVLLYLSSMDNETRTCTINEMIRRESNNLPSFPTEHEFVIEVNNYLIGYSIKNEVKTPLGYVDIVDTKNTDVMIIEVKNNSSVRNITEALGQILCYAHCIPNTIPCICTPTPPSDDSMKLLDAYKIKFLDIEKRT